MERLFRSMARVAVHKYWLVLLAAILLTVVSVVVIVFYGQLATDLRTLLPPGAQYCDALRLAMRRFGSTEELLIVIKAETPEVLDSAKPGLAELAQRLLTHSDIITDVHYKFGEKQEQFVREHLAEKAFLYLDEDDFPLVSRKLSPEGMREELARAKSLFKADPTLFRERVLPDPLNFLELFEKYSKKMGGTYRTSSGDRYLVSPDGCMMIAVVRASGAVQDIKFDYKLLDLVRGEAKAVFGEKPEGFTVDFTGGYAIAVEADRTLRSDVLGTFSVSMAAVLLLFAWAYRRLGMVLYVGVPLGLSVVWTVALAFVVFGRISIISGGFAAILVGLGIDFAIHTYNRYLELRGSFPTPETALEESVASMGEGIFYAALTTAIAFFAVTITEFKGLSELGFLAGAGVIIAMLTMITVLPAMLVARQRITHRGLGELKAANFGLKHLARFIERFAPWITVAVFGTGAAAAWYVLTTFTTEQFDSEFRNLKPAHDPVVDLQDEVMDRFNTNLESVLVMASGASIDDAMQEADGLIARVRGQMETGEVLGYESLLDYVPAPAKQDRAIAFLKGIDFSAVEADFRAAAREHGFKEDSFKDFYRRLSDLRAFAAAPERITVEALDNAGLGVILRRFYAYCPDKGHLVMTYVHPKRGGHPSRWYRTLSDALRVDMSRLIMTSSRQVGYELRDIVYKDFSLITLFVFAGVAACLLVTFRNPLRLIVAVLPLVTGIFWMVATMMLTGMKFNYINSIIMPTIIGIGIDSCIYIVHRYIEDSRIGPAVELTGRGLMMTSLTTIVGFGSLMISQNRGIQSLGKVATLGVFACLVASLVGLPALLHWLGRYIVRPKSVESSGGAAAPQDSAAKE